MAKNYYTLDHTFEMVAADSDSGSEPEYSEPKFSDSDDDMGHVQPSLQNVQSSRYIVDNFVRRGRGRERGTRARQKASEQRGHGRGRQPVLDHVVSGDAVWRRLDGEENYVPWIKDFTAVSRYTGLDGYETSPLLTLYHCF